MRINPERGSKAPEAKVNKKGKAVARKRELVNPHVTTLINKLADFEWCE